MKGGLPCYNALVGALQVKTTVFEYVLRTERQDYRVSPKGLEAHTLFNSLCIICFSSATFSGGSAIVLYLYSMYTLQQTTNARMCLSVCDQVRIWDIRKKSEFEHIWTHLNICRYWNIACNDYQALAEPVSVNVMHFLLMVCWKCEWLSWQTSKSQYPEIST